MSVVVSILAQWLEKESCLVESVHPLANEEEPAYRTFIGGL